MVFDGFSLWHMQIAHLTTHHLLDGLGRFGRAVCIRGLIGRQRLPDKTVYQPTDEKPQQHTEDGHGSQFVTVTGARYYHESLGKTYVSLVRPGANPPK
jgi:hypothetical protein